MFGNDNLNLSRQMFVDQFEPDGENFIYRKHMKAAPIRVSAAERDRYVAKYDKFHKYQFWGMIAGTGVLVVSLATYTVATGIEPPKSALFIGLGAMFAAFMAASFWIWNFPARELRERLPIGDARSRAEIRRLFLARFSYAQIAIGAGAALLLLLRVRAPGSLLSGWNLLWTGITVATLVLSAVQAFRKWRFESRQP